MLKNAINGSLFLTRISRAWEGYSGGVLWIARAYKSSAVYKIGKAVFDFFIACIRSSRICNFFSVKKNVLIVDDSMLIGRCMKMCIRLKSRIIEYALTSKIFIMAGRAKKSVCFDPVRSLGFIILVATITNTSISLLLIKKSGSWAWFMRVIFIIIGTLWVSRRLGMSDLKKTSLSCKLLKKR